LGQNKWPHFIFGLFRHLTMISKKQHWAHPIENSIRLKIVWFVYTKQLFCADVNFKRLIPIQLLIWDLLIFWNRQRVVWSCVHQDRYQNLKYDTAKGREIFLLYEVMVMANFCALLIKKKKNMKLILWCFCKGIMTMDIFLNQTGSKNSRT